jgi:hypothetical protein
VAEDIPFAAAHESGTGTDLPTLAVQKFSQLLEVFQTRSGATHIRRALKWMRPGSEIEEKLGCDGFVSGAPIPPLPPPPFKGAPHPRFHPIA